MADRTIIDKFVAKFSASLADNSFTRLSLSQPTPGDLKPERILARMVELQGRPHLSLTLRHPTRDVTRNLAMVEVGIWLREQLGGVFRSAMLCTTTRDWQFISGEKGGARLVDHKPSETKAPPKEHDKKTAGILDGGAGDWLRGLEILDRDGRLRTSMADKHRQINHYLEIVSHLAHDCGWTGATKSPRPEGGGFFKLSDLLARINVAASRSAQIPRRLSLRGQQAPCKVTPCYRQDRFAGKS